MTHNVDPIEIGDIYHAESNDLAYPHKFTVHAQVGDGCVLLTHHSLAGLLAAYRSMNQTKEALPIFDTQQKWLFIVIKGERMARVEAGNDPHTRMDELLEKFERKTGHFELEDVYGNVQRMRFKRD